MKEHFEKIAALDADWDGEGAEKPSQVAIANAQRFLLALAAFGEPAIGPCADGSIDLWWNPVGKESALVNFTGAGGTSFYAEIGGIRFKGSAHNGDSKHG